VHALRGPQPDGDRDCEIDDDRADQHARAIIASASRPANAPCRSAPARIALPVIASSFFDVTTSAAAVALVARLHECSMPLSRRGDEAIPAEQSVPVLSGKERWQV